MTEPLSADQAEREANYYGQPGSLTPNVNQDGSPNPNGTEPGPRIFTPPPGFPEPHPDPIAAKHTALSSHGRTFWYAGWDTPFFHDLFGWAVRPARHAYDSRNMPEKYATRWMAAGGGEFPPTTRESPVDPQAPKRGFKGKFGDNAGDPPFPPGSFAVEYPHDDRDVQLRLNTYPFDVDRVRKYLGQAHEDAPRSRYTDPNQFAVRPDIGALPNPEGISERMVANDKGALPILRFIMEASGIPFVVKEGYWDPRLPREHPVGSVPFIEGYSITGNTGYWRLVGSTGNKRYSVDDGHLMFGSGHDFFNSIDIAGVNGTREELVALLTYIRQFPELFEEVTIGAAYASQHPMIVRPSSDTHRGHNGEYQPIIDQYRDKPWHYQTGELERGAIIVLDGVRYEKSPLHRAPRYAVPGQTNGPGMPAIHPDDLMWGFDYSLRERGQGRVMGSWRYAEVCCQSDRIHISATPGFLRRALADYQRRRTPSDSEIGGGNRSLGSTPQKQAQKTAPTNHEEAKQKPGKANLPVVVTDLPINMENFFIEVDEGTPTGGGYAFGGHGQNFTLAVVRTPAGFLEEGYAHGLTVMMRLAYPPGTWETQDRFQFGFHKPMKDAKDYATGWVLLDSPDAGPTYDGMMAAQRKGEWIYAIAGQHFQGGQRRTQFVERMNSYKVRERRAHDDSTYYEGLGGAASGATTHSFVPARNMDLHVSDHVEPRLWYLSDFSVGKTTDINGLPMAYHWVQEDQRGHGNGDTSLPFYPSMRFKYEFWHTYQDYRGTGPANTQFPALVFTWRCEDYEPPELWFFVPEQTATGDYTGRLEIYRSLWGPDQWDDWIGWKSKGATYSPLDPRLKVNGGYKGQVINANPGDRVGNVFMFDSMDRNPLREAFNKKWYDKKNLVGVVGPFRGARFGDNQDHETGSARVIRVIRDSRRKDRLHLVMFQKQNVQGTTGWNGVWYCQSQDDGKKWGRPRQMNPTPYNEDGLFSGPEGAAPLAASSDTGDLIGLATSLFKGVPRQTLINITALGGGNVRGVSRERIVFRRDGII